MSEWYLRTQDETFGPESEEKLVEWARMGRIQPGQEISDDNVIWRRVEEVPFLDMRFSIDLGDGNPKGPFNRAAAEALLASGRLPATATIVEARAPFEEAKKEDSAPVESVEEKPAEESEVKPVEKIVEKVVEKIVEVPVEKIVEKIVEKTVVDDTRIRELEGLLEEERRHTSELQSRFDSALKEASARESASRVKAEEFAKASAKREEDLKAEAEAAARESAAKLKECAEREEKLNEQIKALEDELRRLPQTASEVADLQAAMYAIMTKEAEELSRIVEAEKAESEEFRRRSQERADRLVERRHELLKRAGTNIEDMTRKALIECPEDPRTARLRKELDDLRRQSEKSASESERRIRELTEELRDRRANETRSAESMRDQAQLRAEIETLRSQLQLREKDLVAERQKCESMRQQQALSQQTLMARLKTLESPSIGTASSLSTNQSREAKLVKLPSWMRIGK